MKYVIRKKDTPYYVKTLEDVADINFSIATLVSFGKREEVVFTVNNKEEAQKAIDKLQAKFENIVFEIEKA